ncbi:MAG: aspartate aminotransferase family protein [Alphaproteobacteria bacterium]|nr:aspartate aminotransferase family protein [Alphaproteobacteria bacterium]
MKRDEIVAKAKDYMVRTTLLSDIVPAEEGPVIARAEGSLSFDTEGNSYLDFNSGQMCSTLGHNNPRIQKVIEQQSKVLTHASTVYYNMPQVELAERLASINDPPLRKSVFGESGSDSNEVAVLLARRATGRLAVGALTQGFHGLSDSTRAISYSAATAGYGPPMPEVFALPTPYCYRCPYKTDGKGCCMAPLHFGMETLDRQSAGAPAAVIVEPIVSAGGVIELPVEYLQGLRKELDKRGALLIYDEAQTGMGKLGKMFAYQVYGVRPDVLTVSKHLGGGLAVSAAITTDDVAERASKYGFSTGHSHSSDPLACAAGVASIDEIVEKDLPKRAIEIGEHWQSNMRALAQRYELVGDIRGRGLLQGIELVKDRFTKEPATQVAADVYRYSLSHGLMFSVRGKFKNVLRFVPPFTTTNAQLDQAAEILESGLRRAKG